MMWELKKNIDHSHNLLEELKKNPMKKKKWLVESRKNLDHLLVETAEVKLSSRVSDAEDIYVLSSPLDRLHIMLFYTKSFIVNLVNLKSI
ncbi:hypothetical protein EDC94DRAFT_605155 [Helicostylum pulchrum]|nr:hypothetical protein EDC94DRAFT_605155 [Helicostylum pulchrum]